ncbi:hypothetical protein Droror1_Dr00007874 [Drosera rotundifolia]
MTALLDSVRKQFSIKLWPPSEKTRVMLVERTTANLSSENICSRKYGILSKEEAEENAKEIEEKAFTTANQGYVTEPDGDGSSAVQIYAKECSKLVLEVLKRGPTAKVTREVPTSEEVQEAVFDISKGQRAFIEAEEAAELLRPLKEPGNNYAKICFSNRSFGLGAARVAEPILASLKGQLKEVDLSDFIAGRPEAEALEVMTMFSAALEGSNLKLLNLSNNALGEKGIRAFGALLKSQSNLEELYLMNDGISEEAARAVCELVPSTEKLRVLHFHNNMTGDEGARSIAEVVKRSPSLEDFRCSSTRIDSDGGAALSEALESCLLLKKLDLRDNMFGVEAGVALSKALLKHKNLTEIYLSYLNLYDEGAIAIANALKDSASSLEILEIAGNDITSSAASALGACLEAKQSLRKLNLSENELKDEGALLIAKSLEGHPGLSDLDVSTNMIRRAGARVLAQVITENPGFKLLNINGNFISGEGVDEITEMFKKLPDVLGSLDENDREGGDEEEEEAEVLLSSRCFESQREAADLLLGQFAATDSDCMVKVLGLLFLYSPDLQIREMSAFVLDRLAKRLKLVEISSDDGKHESDVDDDDKEDEDDEYCVILDSDPNKMSFEAVDVGDKFDGLAILDAKGQVACRDYPHSRDQCAKFPFDSTPHECHCDLCHCYACDSPAPCACWGSGTLDSDHCHATHNAASWKLVRSRVSMLKATPAPVNKTTEASSSTSQSRHNLVSCTRPIVPR